MAYQKQTWRDFDDTKTELQNINNGAVATPERLNHIENGIANSADKAEVTAQLQQTEQELSSQLADKIGGGVKAEPEDLSATTLGLVTGTGGPINLLSIPQDNSVTKAKLDATLETEIDLLFPPDPNPNVMASINSEPTTVYWFFDGSDPTNVTYSEPIVDGIKEYHIDTTAAYTQLKKPYVALSGSSGIIFDIEPSTTYEFKCDVDQATAKGVFTFFIKNGTTTLDTQYGAFNAGETSEVKAFTTPAGANKFEISLFGFDENVTGEHHLAISNLSLKTVIPQDPDIIQRTETLESTVGTLETTVTGIDGRVATLESVPQKSYFIFDFDNPMLGWDDNRIKIVLEEYGFPFKFVDYGTDPMITSALLRKGCELSTYGNDSVTLPDDTQLESDDAKCDLYVKTALQLQETNAFKNQIVWSNRQFKTGTSLEKALNKYGYRIVRMRGATYLPQVMNAFDTIYVRDTLTGWYTPVLTAIDDAVTLGESLAIFTHLLVNTVEEDRGYDCTVSVFRQVLDKVKAYVDAGQAEVVTYQEYYDRHKA